MNEQTSLIFTHIQVSQLKKYWEIIRADIIKVSKKSEVDYQPIDVLKMLRNEQAFAVDITKNNQHIGTLIIRILKEEFTGKLILHIWILAMENGSLDQVWDFIKDTAEKSHYDLIQVISDRKGWGRRLKKYGFKIYPFIAYHREM